MSEMIHLDIGHYEQIAVELEPVAEQMVVARVQPGSEYWISPQAPATPPCWPPAQAHV